MKTPCLPRERKGKQFSPLKFRKFIWLLWETKFSYSGQPKGISSSLIHSLGEHTFLWEFRTETGNHRKIGFLNTDYWWRRTSVGVCFNLYDRISSKWAVIKYLFSFCCLSWTVCVYFSMKSKISTIKDSN